MFTCAYNQDFINTVYYPDGRVFKMSETIFFLHLFKRKKCNKSFDSEKLSTILISLCTGGKMRTKSWFHCALVEKREKNLDFTVHWWKNENKILISMCTVGKTRTKFWFHCALVEKWEQNIDNDKNTLEILTDLQEQYWQKFCEKNMENIFGKWKMENFKISVSIQWWGGVPVIDNSLQLH